jgi:hypothetical protein
MNASKYVQGLAVDSPQNEQLVMQLADDMAGAAVSFGGAQGYDNFISTRAAFREVVHNFFEDIRINANWIHKNPEK